MPHRRPFASFQPAVLGRRRLAYLLAVMALGAGLAACSGSDGGSADAAGTVGESEQAGDHEPAAETGGSAQFDTALGESPCAIATKDIVADTFDVPAGELEQLHTVASDCDYEWDGIDTSLAATVSVEAFETVDAAAENFASVTQSMSANAVSEAMSKIEDAAGASGEMDSAGEKQAADATGSAMAGAIQYEDVDSVGDAARFETDNGTLYVRDSNLRLRITAYKGPSMPMPDELSAAAISKATAEWQKETMAERRTQTVELAKAVVTALEG